MDKINGLTISIVICSVMACIVELLINDGKYEKTIRAVLGCVILCVIATPLTGFSVEMFDMGNTLTKNEYDIDNDNMELEQLEREYIDKQLSKTTENILKENALSYTYVSTSIIYNDKQQAENIQCTININGSDKSSIPRLKEVIRSKLGVEPEVICVSSE